MRKCNFAVVKNTENSALRVIMVGTAGEKRVEAILEEEGGQEELVSFFPIDSAAIKDIRLSMAIDGLLATADFGAMALAFEHIMTVLANSAVQAIRPCP